MAGLMTPVKERGGGGGSAQHNTMDIDMRLQDSPFSDYFSNDDARSVDHNNNHNNNMRATVGGAPYYDAPGSETQHLLVRLSRLQAQLMRTEEREVLNLVGRKVGEVEAELEALHSQTRMPADLEDSGLFMDDDDDDRELMVGVLEEGEGEGEGTPAARPDSAAAAGLGIDDHTSELDVSSPPIAMDTTVEPELDVQLEEARRVLENVSRAQEELRKRHTELVALNDTHLLQIEDSEHEVEQLRSENEGLKADLGFDHSELLFLKLQMKALEVEVDGVCEAPQVGGRGSQGGDCGGGRGRRVLEDLNRWRRDWHDVDARFKRRQSRSGVLAAERREQEPGELGGENDGSGAWQLETVKKGAGRRVSSITINRLDGIADEQPSGLRDDRAAATDQAEAEPASSYADQSCQTEREEIEHHSSADQSCQTEREEIEHHSSADQGCQTQQAEAESLPSSSDQGCQTGQDEVEPVSFTDQACQTSDPVDAVEPVNPIQGPRHSYADQSTQTLPTPPSPPLSLHTLLADNGQWTGNGDEDTGYASSDSDDADADSCAITTSAPTPAPQSPVTSPLRPTTKSAWAELWEDLGYLAGMGEEEER